jgi:ribonucleoside-diphosphate reductase alpha chain
MMKQQVKISLDRDNLLSEHAKRLLKDFYMLDGETSPQEAYSRAAIAWSNNDMQLAQRLYDAASKNWFVFASPVLSNAPAAGEQTKGLPISCFLSYVADDLHSLINHSTETRWLSVKGGGVGGHWSDVRAISDIAPGPIPFIHTVDADTIAYRQGKTRKGSYAAYLDVSHPDIIEFLHIRVPTGDINRKCLNIHHAINITDAFMDSVASDKDWKLIDPKTKEVRDVVRARQLWEQILEIRYRTGEPYLNFIDTANKHLPKQLKEKGLKIHGSNLCNEIHLPTNNERTAVCCLSSLNLEYYDEWRDTNLVSDLVRMLDNVLEYFIKCAPAELSKAVKSAYNERSIGLGAMGFHSLLQRRSISFESTEANSLNEAIFKEIKEKAVEASKRLAHERGEAPDMAGTGMRNAHLLAIAPNANSSIIADTSPSIEPFHANAFVHRTRAGSYLVRNKYLEKHLNEINKNDDATWSSIISHRGSVRHLDFLDVKIKAVFRTAMEIDQDWVIRHAADRQKYICQGQSVNLFFPANASRAYINRTHISAWKNGLKGLYYLRTEASSSTEEVGKKVDRVALKDAEPVACSIETKECEACSV